MNAIVKDNAEITSDGDGQIAARIVRQTLEADDICSYELRSVDGGMLPAWTPGAHIDIHLPSGLVRQYSLCGEPMDRQGYRIAVLRQPDGRGGSLEVHDVLRVGQILMVGRPRNEFELLPSPRYLFVAGGIGITPILAMVREAAARGADWRLMYGARSRRRMSFLSELASLANGRLDLRSDEDGAGVVVSQIVDAARAGAEVYACGPQGLLDALEAQFAEANLLKRLHIERFAPVKAAPLPDDGAVRVILGRQGGYVDVPVDCSILDALRQAGHDIPSSCEQGFCGTCETRVLDGIPDHRDTLLSEKERAACRLMMPCVSRSRTPTLTLDL